MKKLKLQLNLTKIRQILSNNTLNLKKHAAVTPELIAKYKQGDMDAANTIAQEILKDVHGAMKHLGIMKDAPPQEWKDFRDKTALRIWEYSLPRYDPTKSKFSTFVFNMVNNMWKNWLKQKSTTPLDVSKSLNEPVGEEENTSGMEMLQDPLALNFKSEVEAKLIESALLENIQDPRQRDILKLWMEEDPRMGPVEKRDIVAKKYNMEHPGEKPIKGYRVYRILTDEIYPKILDMFPEMAKGVGYMKNPEPAQNKKWVRAPKEELKEVPEENLEEAEEEELPPLSEELNGPVYRINPQTGERTLISLNLKRKITATGSLVH